MCMKRKFYFAAATLLMAAMTVNAQQVIEIDTEFTDPASWGTHVSERDIIIAGATVTFANEAMNYSAFHGLYVDTVRLYNGAKIVMFDSPDMWYADEATYEEWGADLDDADGNLMTAMNYNFKVMGEATIVCDSKGRIGGTITSEDGDSTSVLNLVIGDSTVLAANFNGFFGQLNIIYREEAKNQVLHLGEGFPGTCHSCGNNYTKASSAVCWDGIPFIMNCPDNILLKVYDNNIPMAYPGMLGQHINIDNGTGHIFFRHNQDWTYSFGTVTGGSDARNLELYAGGNATLYDDIAYIGKWAYPRNCGVWINGEDSIFTGMLNEVSVRNSGGFVGGKGILACGIAMKEGSGRNIVPGEAYFTPGDLTVGGSVYLYNANGIELDFGANGNYDRLVVSGARDPKCYISGATTRLIINVLDEFHAAPKAGDYQVVVADEFVPNTVYETDTTGIRFRDWEGADALLDELIAADTTGTYTVEKRDSLKNAWGYMFENFKNPSKKDRDTLFCNITKIDTLSWEINQAVEFKPNKREDGTSWDALPEGYSWYPLDIYEQYGNDSVRADSAGKAMISEKFFARGIISIYGPSYKEEIVSVNRPGAEAIEGVLPADRKVVSSQIYNAEGMPVPVAEKGVNIVRTVYSDGTVDTRKIISDGE